MTFVSIDSEVTIGVLVPFGFFTAAGAAFSLLERVAPVRQQARARGLAVDTLGLGVAWLTSGAVIALVGRVLSPFQACSAMLSLPPLVRAVLYIVFSDFLRFLTHWLMHRNAFWPAHRFHHSIRVLYWFSGNRASVLHVTFFMAPMAFGAWLFHVDRLAVTVNVIIMILWNHLMHTNARIPPRFQQALEYVVTTPRYHHIHHSEDARHRGVNLGSIFTVWDRMSGTYVDPNSVAPWELQFGSDDASRGPLWRRVIGV